MSVTPPPRRGDPSPSRAPAKATRSELQAAHSRSSSRPRSDRRGRSLLALLIVVVLLIPLAVGALWLYHKVRPGPSASDTPSVTLAPDVTLLLPPGLTTAEIAARVGEIPGKDAAKFLAVVTSGTIRSRYQPADVSSLDGFLFPDTYFIGATESEESIVRRLVDRFDEIGDKINLGSATKMTPYQTVIAASLIQKEAKLAEDAPLISAVIGNRLADEMLLQIDATLCLIKGGCPPGPTNADKEIDSPYNTYKNIGLPPTPICSVTEASLLAAMNPSDVKYKFYVLSDANGKHAFATTLAEHDRNVAAARAKGLL